MEGSTIEHQDSSILSVSSSVLVSTQPQEDMTSPVDLSFLNKQSPEASAQPAAGDLRDVRFGTDVVHEGAPQTIPSDNITSSTDCVSCELQGLAIAVEDQSPQTQEDMEKSSKAHSRSDIFSDPEPSISRKTLVFSKEGFVFQVYSRSQIITFQRMFTVLPLKTSSNRRTGERKLFSHLLFRHSTVLRTSATPTFSAARPYAILE